MIEMTNKGAGNMVGERDKNEGYREPGKLHMTINKLKTSNLQSFYFTLPLLFMWMHASLLFVILIIVKLGFVCNLFIVICTLRLLLLLSFERPDFFVRRAGEILL